MKHQVKALMLAASLLIFTAVTAAQDKPLTPASPIVLSVPAPSIPVAQELPTAKLDLNSILPLMIGTGGKAQYRPLAPAVPIVLPLPAPGDPEAAKRIPLNSKVYIAPMGGFESYLAAALREKHVPLMVVSDRDQADFEITGTAETKHASGAKIFVIGDVRNRETATFTVTNLKTKIIAWADSSDRGSAWDGKKSTSEKLAKFLGEKMKADEKKYGR